MAIIQKPKRETGRAVPDPNDKVAQARAEHARDVIQNLWVETDGQRAILNNLRSYMRVSSKRRPRAPIKGRRLSQFSQAGKSAIVARLIVEVAEEDIASGRVPNQYRVIHITINKRMTVKMLYQRILNRLGDDFDDSAGHVGVRLTPEQKSKIKGSANENIEVKEQRIEEWCRRLGVELVVIDEVQRLVTKPKIQRFGDADPDGFLTPDAEEVTTRLQTFLDNGVVPVAFIGDETSRAFFDLNPQFRPRLDKPLELLPLDPDKGRDRKRFADFCIGYDEVLQKQNVVVVPTCLSEPRVLAALLIASGGHIGRAARIIEMALVAALERGALTMEAYDLSNAVREFAIDNDWVGHDPFSVQPSNDELVRSADGEVSHAN